MIDSYTIINISKLKQLYISTHNKRKKKFLYVSATSPIKRKKCGKNTEKMSVYMCYIVSVKKLASS